MESPNHEALMNIPCSDCGERGKVILKEAKDSKLLPKGEKEGYFDPRCWLERKKDSDAGLPPRPLGQKRFE
jgi:hypothetical protein